MNNVFVLVSLGLALHVIVGGVGGRVLVRLTQSNDSPSKISQWVAYAGGLLVMIGYGFAAGYLVKALRNHDAILVTFAVVMLATCLLTYLRYRSTPRL
jgi:hypothetical protein